MLKLNGGLGTSMGLDKAKSLLEVKGGNSFLDLTAKQVITMRIELMQNKVPKVDKSTLGPVSWVANPHLDWCPPGHGDLYTALYGSGKLDELLADGVKYMFVSNSDNLGATLDIGKHVLSFS